MRGEREREEKESVRLIFLSRVGKIDIGRSEVELSHENSTLAVNTRLLGPLPIRAGALWQFIGELGPGPTVRMRGREFV